MKKLWAKIRAFWTRERHEVEEYLPDEPLDIARVEEIVIDWAKRKMKHSNRLLAAWKDSGEQDTIALANPRASYEIDLDTAPKVSPPINRTLFKVERYGYAIPKVTSWKTFFDTLERSPVPPGYFLRLVIWETETWDNVNQINIYMFVAEEV